MSRSSTSSRFSDDASGERREQQCRAQVGEQFQARAQRQQAALGTLIHRQSVPPLTADCAEQHRIGVLRAAVSVAAGNGDPVASIAHAAQ